MKKLIFRIGKTFVFCSAMTFFISCEEEGNKLPEAERDTSRKKMELGEFQGDAYVPYDHEMDTVNPPELTFEVKEYDFGSVEEGKLVKYAFKFKNTGKSDLIITDAKAGCSCTVPTIPLEPIAPGESGQIDVVFNSEGKGNSSQSKTIRVYANTYPEMVTKVVLKGKVK